MINNVNIHNLLQKSKKKTLNYSIKQDISQSLNKTFWLAISLQTWLTLFWDFNLSLKQGKIYLAI